MDLNKAYELYRILLKIRLVEEAIIEEYAQKEIRTPVHLCIGQEAIAAGVSFNLKKEDYIVSNHRCHGHAIAKGLSLDGFFKEIYGKKGGVSSGWGGSMHLCGMEHGIVGTSAIVAGGIPIGAGVALKQKIGMESNITVIYFGDGAVDEGVFWETVNISALMKLPILFVFEDNRFASQTPEELRHSYSDIKKIISGFGIPAYETDGNNAVEIEKTSRELIERIREGQGPVFLSCKTYRWMGHVGISDDTDTGYRDRQEVEFWKKRCPLEIMETYLKREDPENIEKISEEFKLNLKETINNAIQRAKEAPYAVD